MNKQRNETIFELNEPNQTFASDTPYNLSGIRRNDVEYDVENYEDDDAEYDDETERLQSILEVDADEYKVTKKSEIKRKMHACSILVTLVLLASIFTLIIYTSLSSQPLEQRERDNWNVQNDEVVGCNKIIASDVWVVGFPKLMTESAFRLVDVNEDSIYDVIFGFATGAEGHNVPDIVCDIYFEGQRPCLGGVLALDGVTGSEIWKHYTQHEIFSLNCQLDLNSDGVEDCLAAGRVGTLVAIDGKSGTSIWSFDDEDPARVEDMNLYTAQFVGDFDKDGVPDIVDVHGGDPMGEPGSATRLPGRVILLSGKTGKSISYLVVPDGKETYYSPVLHNTAKYLDTNKTKVGHLNLDSLNLIFGTGGETHSGSLWAVNVNDLQETGLKKAKEIYSGNKKGIMTPPALIDVTGDSVDDVVFATYNSTVVCLDGSSYRPVWNFTYPLSETYATPAPGYYNDDDIPDFLVHWQYGPGYPVYFHSVTTVVDGKTGRPLITPYIRSAVGAQSSPLSIRVEGLGNDIFLYWNADCSNHEGDSAEFKFNADSDVHKRSRTDICRLRFKTAGVSKLRAMNSHSMPPGVIIYDSDEKKEVEHQWTVDTVHLAQQYIASHPLQRKQYLQWIESLKHASKKERKKRHVGPHDENGLQRLISTGTLAPSLRAADNSIDVIFATYWFYPRKTQALLSQERKCVEDRLGGQEERFQQSIYFGMDNDAYEHTVTEECVSKSKAAEQTVEKDGDQHQQPRNNDQDETDYNPYALSMGQLTVYRLKLECRCGDLQKGQNCSRILPYDEQPWASYMGTNGDSIYSFRKPYNKKNNK